MITQLGAEQDFRTMLGRFAPLVRNQGDHALIGDMTTQWGMPTTTIIWLRVAFATAHR